MAHLYARDIGNGILRAWVIPADDDTEVSSPRTNAIGALSRGSVMSGKNQNDEQDETGQRTASINVSLYWLCVHSKRAKGHKM